MRLAFPLLCAITFPCAADDATSIVALARTSAPEFFADAVIRLVHAGKIEEPAAGRALLEEAFAAAARVREPFPAVSIIHALEGATAAGIAAHPLGLDTLSLRSRIVIEMSSIDSPRARELFATIAKPSSAQRNCSDVLVANPVLYYDAMITSAPLETGVGELLGFLEKEVPRTSSWLDLWGIARVIQAAPFNLGPRVYLTRLMVDRLPDIRPMRSCPGDPQGTVRPIQPAYDEFEGAELLRAAFQKFQTMPSGGPRFEEEKATEEWRDLLTDFLREWESWRPSGSAEEAFHQKAFFLLRVLNVTPRSGKWGVGNRERLLQSAASFLATFGIERRIPAEWLWRVRAFDQAAGADRPKFRALLRETGSIDLLLFVALTQVP